MARVSLASRGSTALTFAYYYLLIYINMFR